MSPAAAADPRLEDYVEAAARFFAERSQGPLERLCLDYQENGPSALERALLMEWPRIEELAAYLSRETRSPVVAMEALIDNHYIVVRELRGRRRTWRDVLLRDRRVLPGPRLLEELC